MNKVVIFFLPWVVDLLIVINHVSLNYQQKYHIISMLTCRYFFFSRNMRADLEQFSKGRGPRTYFRTTPYIGNDDRKSFVWSGGGGGGGVRGIFLK